MKGPGGRLSHRSLLPDISPWGVLGRAAVNHRRHLRAGTLDQWLVTRGATGAPQGHRAGGDMSYRVDETGAGQALAPQRSGQSMDYMLKRVDAFTRFLEDGRICLSNNAAERELRGIAMTESFYTSSSSICKH